VPAAGEPRLTWPGIGLSTVFSGAFTTAWDEMWLVA